MAEPHKASCRSVVVRPFPLVAHLPTPQLREFSEEPLEGPEPNLMITGPRSCGLVARRGRLICWLERAGGNPCSCRSRAKKARWNRLSSSELYLINLASSKASFAVPLASFENCAHVS